MIQMVAFEMPEEAIAKLSEMQEIVYPLFADIALPDTRKEGGESADGKKETEGRGHEKEPQDNGSRRRCTSFYSERGTEGNWRYVSF